LSLIRDLYLRFQILIHEIGKFGLVGILGTIITISIQNALYKPHGYWAFKLRKTDNVARETVLFVIFNVLGLLIQLAFVSGNAHLLHNHSRLDYNIANVIGIIIATLFRLFCYRTFVFRAVPEAAAAEELSEPVTIP
jgi:putative flippase GtrA